MSAYHQCPSTVRLASLVTDATGEVAHSPAEALHFPLTFAVYSLQPSEQSHCKILTLCTYTYPLHLCRRSSNSGGEPNRRAGGREGDNTATSRSAGVQSLRGYHCIRLKCEVLHPERKGKRRRERAGHGMAWQRGAKSERRRRRGPDRYINPAAPTQRLGCTTRCIDIFYFVCYIVAQYFHQHGSDASLTPRLMVAEQPETETLLCYTYIICGCVDSSGSIPHYTQFCTRYAPGEL